MNWPGIPFLMYHAIRGENGSGEADPRYTVALAEFERQLAYLHEAGFQTISLAQFLDWHRHGDSLPANPIVLTFDDGDPSHFELVLPRLKQHGFRAAFSVVPSWIGTTRSLSVEQLRALQAAGMEIMSHGMHHIPLTDLPLPKLRQELLASRIQLEAWLKRPVLALAIPRGFSNVRVRKAINESGYQVVCTSRPRHNHRSSDRYTLGRIPIRAHVRLDDFIGLVQGHTGQHARELSSYWVRHSAQRLLGTKRYDRLRGFLLRPRRKGAIRHA